MHSITEIRKTGRTYDNGGGKKFTVQYTVYLGGDEVIDVRNSAGFSIEKGSDTWDYFVSMVPRWREMKRIPV